MQMKKLIAVASLAAMSLLGASQVNAYASKYINYDPFFPEEWDDTQVAPGQVLRASLDIYLGQALLRITRKTNVSRYLTGMNAKCSNGTVLGPGTKTATTVAGGAQTQTCGLSTPPVEVIGVIDVQ